MSRVTEIKPFAQYWQEGPEKIGPELIFPAIYTMNLQDGRVITRRMPNKHGVTYIGAEIRERETNYLSKFTRLRGKKNDLSVKQLICSTDNPNVCVVEFAHGEETSNGIQLTPVVRILYTDRQLVGMTLVHGNHERFFTELCGFDVDTTGLWIKEENGLVRCTTQIDGLGAAGLSFPLGIQPETWESILKFSEHPRPWLVQVGPGYFNPLDGMDFTIEGER